MHNNFVLAQLVTKPSIWMHYGMLVYHIPKSCHCDINFELWHHCWQNIVCLVSWTLLYCRRTYVYQDSDFDISTNLSMKYNSNVKLDVKAITMSIKSKSPHFSIHTLDFLGKIIWEGHIYELITMRQTHIETMII